MLYHFRVIWRWIILTFKRSLKVIQTGAIRKFGCGFLFAFHSDYGSSFHYFRDKKARYWSKMGFFSYPVSLDAAVRRVPVGILPSFDVEKLEWWGYPTLADSEQTLRIHVCITVWTEYRSVTDRRTDRQTTCPRHSPRYAYASRGNKICQATNVHIKE